MKWYIVYIVVRGIVMFKSYNDILNGNVRDSKFCCLIYVVEYFFFLNYYNLGVFVVLNFKYNLICEGLFYFLNYSKLM